MHPIFLTSPLITVIIGPLVVFATCKRSHEKTLAPAQTRSSSHQPQHHFVPQCLPAATKSHRAHIHLQFLLGDTEKHGRNLRRCVPKTILTLPFCSHFRRFLCSAPLLQKLQPNFSLHLWVRGAWKSSARPSVTFFFQLFFCGWKTYLPVGSRVGRIWPVAIFLLEKSHGDVGTLETSWGALSSRVFLNLTCEVPANKQGQIPVMPLRVVAPGTCHSVGLHFSASVGTVFF